MGRAKRVLGKQEEKARSNTNKIARDMQQQVVDGSTPIGNSVLQLGTMINGVGVVTDTELMQTGRYVQVKYTVSGVTASTGTIGYVTGVSESVPATRSIDQRELMDAMKLHVKGILQASARGTSTYIQRMISEDTYDISTLVNALDLCESTLQSLYALTRIAGEMDDVDYPRFLQSLRTLIVDESGIEVDAHPWSTPLENSDGTAGLVGDGLLKIYEKNGSTDHMAGLAQDTTVVDGHLICGACHVHNLPSNIICAMCGHTLKNLYPAQYAQEMYGTFSDPQQTCTNCGATIEDKAHTCRRCGVSVYSSPIMDTSGFTTADVNGVPIPISGVNGTVKIGKTIHPILCGGCNKYYMDDKDRCPGCQTPRDSSDTHPIMQCPKCKNTQAVGWSSCMNCYYVFRDPGKDLSPMDKVDTRL